MFHDLTQAIENMLNLRRDSRRSQIEPLFESTATVVERLEQRTMLAGNVSVTTNAAGDVRIVGSADDNQVLVQSVAGIVQVVGLSGTTVNGGFGALIVITNNPSTIDRNLTITMKGGNDRVEIDDVGVVGDIRVNMGSGDDTVGVFDTIIGDDLMVNTGTGADVVAAVDLGIVDMFRIVTGSGGDAIGIQECVVVGGRTTINTGSGVDGLFLGGTYNDRVAVNMGSDNDVLAVKATAGGGGTRFLLGGGDDLMYVHQITNMPGGPLVVGGGGIDSAAIHIFSTFAPNLRSVENPVFTTTVNTAVDAIGVGFVITYAARGGDPTDLVC